jgi:serine/threonine protein kinase
LQPGSAFAGFEIKSTLGEGGMGAVYRAHDPRLARDVALKVLPGDDADDEARARFLREAKALARVSHENVVRVYSSGVDEGIAWMSLALIEGDALDRVLGNEPLDEETALLLAASCARGLAAVHREGVVHRDVKPANILIDESGQLHIVDFGIATFTDVERGGFKTRDGLAVGTPHYMSPEQARGGAVDARADAWGLGATLYAMLAGAPPFFHTSDEADVDILARVLRDRAPDLRARAPRVSAMTARLVASLLDPDRESRPTDLDDVAASLEKIAESLAVESSAGESRDAEDAHDDGERERPVVDALPIATAHTIPIASSSSSAPPSPSRALTVLVGVLVLVLVSAGVAFVVVGFDRSQRDVARDDDARAGELEPGNVETRPPDATPLRIAPPDSPVVANPPVVTEPPDPLVALTDVIRAGTKDSADAARTLVSRDDEAARELAKSLVVDPATSGHIMAALVTSRPPHAVSVLSVALAHPTRDVAERAIEALTALRPIEAIALLNNTASTHPVPEVRARARDARKALFSVEGE